MPPYQPIAERFAKYVKRGKKNECWPWLGSYRADGYGQIASDLRPGAAKANRIAYRLFYKKNPGKAWVLHTCDNPKCVNPHHLYLGNAQTNVDDMMRKGRGPTGERNGHAKLTAVEIRAIRKDKRFQYVIAAQYKIIQQTVSDIKLRKRWKHLK